jgi:hypothetical protein
VVLPTQHTQTISASPHPPTRTTPHTTITQHTPTHRQFFREQYDALNAQLFSANRAAFPLDAYSYERFAWAVATVRSRLHAPLDAEPLALVPLADAVRGVVGAGRACRARVHGVRGRVHPQAATRQPQACCGAT